MRKLFKYLKGSYLACIIAPLLMILEVTMDLQQPRFVSQLIDVGIANRDIGYIWATGAKMIGCALIGVMGGVGCTIFASIAATSYGTRLRQAVFDKIQTFSFKEIDEFKTSSLITRLTNDVTQIQNIVMMGLKMLIRAPFMCVGGIIMALSMSRSLSMILWVSLPLILIVITIIMKRTFPLFLKVQRAIDRVNTVMRENLMGVRVIKAFVTHQKEKGRFSEANNNLKDIGVKSQRTMNMMNPLVNLIMNSSVIAALWFGGLQSMDGAIKTGQIVAFVNYLTQIMFSFMMVSMMIINISRAKASADRIVEVLNKEPSIKDPKEPEVPKSMDIEFKNVSFKYYESEEEAVLEDVSFKVKQGETVGIIGATGSGKSSLISLILRLYDVTEGQVLLGGVDVRDIDQRVIRDNVGIVLQDTVLFAGSISDNLRWGKPDASPEDIRSACEAAQANEFINDKEEGYDSFVEQRGKNFSGGQKQRLSIARTLIKNPRILIMDDSTSALDMTTEAKLQKAIASRKGNMSMFIIAQRISSVMGADKIIVLDNGRIESIGKHKELIEASPIYRDIVLTQLGEEEVKNA